MENQNKTQDPAEPGPSFALNLYRRRQNGEITQAEMDKEMAYWTLQTTFDSLKYIPLPDRPQELIEYYELSEDKRKKVNAEFWQQPVVKKYLELKQGIRMENDSTLRSLEILKEKLPDTDQENLSKVYAAIADFKARRDMDKKRYQGGDNVRTQTQDTPF